jgi:hypothetical protein
MKKNKFLFLGMLALVLTFTLVLSGCPDPYTPPAPTAAETLAADLGTGAAANAATVTLSGNVTLTKAVTVPAGVTLVVPEGKTLATTGSYALTVNGALTLTGTGDITGSLIVDGAAASLTAAAIPAADKLTVKNGGTATAAGKVYVGTNGIYSVPAGATFEIAPTGVSKTAYAVKAGTVTVNATPYGSKTETIESGDSLTVDANATLAIASAATLTVNGALTANGTVNVNGTLTVAATVEGQTVTYTSTVDFGTSGSAVFSTTGKLVASLGSTNPVVIGSGGLFVIANGNITVGAKGEPREGTNIGPFGLGHLYFNGNVALNPTVIPSVAEDISLVSGTLTIGSGTIALFGTLDIAGAANMLGTLSSASVLRFGTLNSVDGAPNGVSTGKAIFYTTTSSETAAVAKRNFIYTWTANAGGTSNAGWVKTSEQQ